MTTYQVCGKVTVSCWTTVEARSPEEAIAKAQGHEMAEFQIDGCYPEDECWHMDSDGAPSELVVEAAP